MVLVAGSGQRSPIRPLTFDSPRQRLIEDAQRSSTRSTTLPTGSVVKHKRSNSLNDFTLP